MDLARTLEEPLEQSYDLLKILASQTGGVPNGVGTSERSEINLREIKEHGDKSRDIEKNQETSNNKFSPFPFRQI